MINEYNIRMYELTGILYQYVYYNNIVIHDYEYVVNYLIYQLYDIQW